MSRFSSDLFMFSLIILRYCSILWLTFHFNWFASAAKHPQNFRLSPNSGSNMWIDLDLLLNLNLSGEPSCNCCLPIPSLESFHRFKLFAIRDDTFHALGLGHFKLVGILYPFTSFRASIILAHKSLLCFLVFVMTAAVLILKWLPFNKLLILHRTETWSWTFKTLLQCYLTNFCLRKHSLC